MIGIPFMTELNRRYKRELHDNAAAMPLFH
jgi:biopolymer transport protein ExbB